MSELERLRREWGRFENPYTVALETEVATLRSLIQMERQQAEQRVQAVERERDIAREQNEQKRTMLQEGADAFYSQERKLDQAEARAEELRRERDRLRGAILTHVASAIGDPLETGQAYAAFLARYDAAHPAPEEEADRG